MHGVMAHTFSQLLGHIALYALHIYMHYTHTPGDYTQIDTFRVSFGLQLLFSIYVLLRSFQNFPP